MSTLEDKMYEVTHNLWKLFDTLDSEQLDSIESLLKAIAVSSEPVSTSMYYSGMIEGILSSKFGVCPTCKTAHGEGDKNSFFAAMADKVGNRTDPKASTPDPDARPGTYL